MNIPENPGAVNGQSTSDNAFTTWAAAGFQSELLPVIPPNAPLSEHTRINPDSRGKTPGDFDGQAWGGLSGWQTRVATEADIARWASFPGASVGLHARRHPGVDIDVLDQGVSEALGKLAVDHLGAAPERIGQAPKRLMLYKLAQGAEPLRKRRIEFQLPGDDREHAVEVLGDGQQFVIEGTHPRTGNPYQWQGVHPTATGSAALTQITADDVSAYLEAVEAHVKAAGGVVTGTGAGGAGTAPARNQDGLKGDPETVRSALEALGNDQPYDEWIKLVAACKAALGEDGYDIYEAWCLEYPGNTPEQARYKWDSCRAPYRVGAEYIYEQAGRAGWEGVGRALGFQPHLPAGLAASPAPDPACGSTHAATYAMPVDGVSDAPNLEDYVQDWVYAVEQERFVRLSDGNTLKEPQFIRQHASPSLALSGKQSAAGQYFAHPAARKVDTLTYEPGGGMLTQDGGRTAANTYRPTDVERQAHAKRGTVTDADVRPYLDHVERLIPEPRERGIVLDWIAYVLQHPDQKPNWAVFVGGEQGCGKDSMFLPVMRATGKANYSQVKPRDLTRDHNDWIANKRLVVVNEMQNFDRKGVMNDLKIYITRPPETVPVHQKYMTQYSIPNIAVFLFMSNYRDALQIEHGDRRFFVYWSDAPKCTPAYSDKLYAWLDSGGAVDTAAWLLQRDVSAFDAQGHAPDTADKTAMQREAQPEAVKKCLELIDGYNAPFAGEITSPIKAADKIAQDYARLGIKAAHVEQALRLAGGGPIPAKGGKSTGGHQLSLGHGYGRIRVRAWAVRDLDTWADQEIAPMTRECAKALGLSPEESTDKPEEVQDTTATVDQLFDEAIGKTT